MTTANNFKDWIIWIKNEDSSKLPSSKLTAPVSYLLTAYRIFLTDGIPTNEV